ncbi:MAG: PD40 domain-containing protein [Acidobacteria bacterium]|nr:PD40 domain-containing protein [Acidobacteriota bacterium]
MRKHGRRIKLQDQPFRVLVALLEKPGDVVTRDELRERIWGKDTFVDFDHRINAAVNRLREALGDSSENPRYVETVARRGYRFVGSLEGLPEAVHQSAPGARSYAKPLWAAVACVALFVAVGLGFRLTRRFWLTRHGVMPAAQRLVRLTASPGSEDAPAFSPDGNQVAFVWNGDGLNNFDIYVKMTGSGTALRLTTDPAVDDFPAWSPDGSQIAFLSSRAPRGLYVVSPLGGPVRKLADLDWAPARPSWSVDGKFVVSSRTYNEPPQPGDGAVVFVPAEGSREVRTMLIPKPGTRYLHPAFSPDGRELAVVHCQGPMCQLQVLSLDRELLPKDPPRTIQSEWSYVYGLAWTPDGDSVVASGFRPPDHHLWRVPVRTTSEPKRIELAGDRALRPAISRKGNRLAFAHSTSKPDIWRWERGRRSSPFLHSTVRDTNPQFSPDGRRIAFESARDGQEIAIWTANANGTGAVRITRGLGGTHSGTPRWSPCGRWLAFDSQSSTGRFDVWTVEVGGGPPVRLTDGTADNAAPSWSRDGKRIYFTSNRSGRHEIWSVPAEGGEALQITHSGGYTVFESAGGGTLYFTRSASGIEGLYALRLDAAREKQVFTDPVECRSFTVFPDGICYVSPGRSDLHEIRFHEFATRRTRRIGDIEGLLHLGFSVSPDRKTFLFSKRSFEYDLMLIENFR